MSALTVFLALLFVIPARLVVEQLGAAGTPAQIFGMAILLWWVAGRLTVDRSQRRLQPVAKAMLVFAAAILASYLAATTRPIEDIELRAADRGLLSLCAWMGILLLSSQGIPSKERLDTLLRRVVLAGGALATLGLIQFVTRRSWADLIQIPGLSPNADQVGVFIRNGLARPAGTATHPIEYGVVLAMVLPLALHYALHDTHRQRLRRWFPVAAIALAAPISLSRSTILGVVVVMLFLLPTWTRRLRWRAYLATVIALSAVYVAVPGLLGTFRKLFFGIGTDSSALSRTDSYSLAWEFIVRAPVFGRGVGTFLPSYRILDNQYLGSTIETGFVGVAALLALLLTGVLSARRVRRASGDPRTRDLAQSLAAAIAAGMLSFATFDALGFPMVAGMVFLLLGTVGALTRLERREPSEESQPDRGESAERVETGH